MQEIADEQLGCAPPMRSPKSDTQTERPHNGREDNGSMEGTLPLMCRPEDLRVDGEGTDEKGPLCEGSSAMQARFLQLLHSPSSGQAAFRACLFPYLQQRLVSRCALCNSDYAASQGRMDSYNQRGDTGIGLHLTVLHWLSKLEHTRGTCHGTCLEAKDHSSHDKDYLEQLRSYIALLRERRLQKFSRRRLDKTVDCAHQRWHCHTTREDSQSSRKDDALPRQCKLYRSRALHSVQKPGMVCKDWNGYDNSVYR